MADGIVLILAFALNSFIKLELHSCEKGQSEKVFEYVQ